MGRGLTVQCKRWILRSVALIFAAFYVSTIRRLHINLLQPEAASGTDGSLTARTSTSTKEAFYRLQSLHAQSPQAFILDDTKAHTSKELDARLLRDPKLYVHPSPSYKIDFDDLWETSHASNTFPPWMKEYFRWHKQTRQGLNPQNWKTTRYLLVTCPTHSRKCGGLADRLAHLPFCVRLAAQTHRLLLYQWGRPAALEQYLQPPSHGMDWRVPPWLDRAFREDGNNDLVPQATVQDSVLGIALDTENVTIANIRFQSHDHGMEYYNQFRQRNETDFVHVFHDLWQTVFTPAPRVAAKLQKFWQTHQLVPYTYPSAHLRALYAIDARPSPLIRKWARNAVECLAQFGVDSVYFASDSSVAINSAVRFGRERRFNVTIVNTAPEGERATPALHIDKTNDWQHLPAAAFDPTFVDLYALSSSSCVGISMGGYGRLASWISPNVSCSFVHHTAAGVVPCPLRKEKNALPTLARPSPWLLPPVSESNEPHRSALNATVFATDILEGTYPFPRRLQDMTGDLWQHSTILPTWMKTYFSWHREQRKLLQRHNWQNFRFLVMVCLEKIEKCGGTSDRLRSIPFMIRVAAQTDRILLIYWEQPFPLEFFLLPPVGGMDWRTPQWLRPILRQGSVGESSVRKVVKAANNRRRVIVTAKLQAHDHGSQYYNNEVTESAEALDALRQHYHDTWYTVFTPIPIIARRVEDDLESMRLVPGKFAVAHVRANYGIEQVGREPELVFNWTKNSINCLSNLNVSGPIFVASDNSYAKQVAVDYGKEQHIRVVSRLDDEKGTPLHLDLANWEIRDPSEYYDVFVDLYLMSMGRCMTYNMGGYGKWGQLISGRNLTCSVRHWTKGVGKFTADKDGCVWTGMSAEEEVSEYRLQRPLFLPPVKNELEGGNHIYLD